MSCSCVCFQSMSKIVQKLSLVQMFEATGYSVEVFSKITAFLAFRMMAGISCSSVLFFIRSSFPFSSSMLRACLKLTKTVSPFIVGCC